MRDEVNASDIILMAAVWVGGLVAGGIIVYKSSVKPLQQQAVAHGCAYWHVLEDGTTEFRWKEEE